MRPLAFVQFLADRAATLVLALGVVLLAAATLTPLPAPAQLAGESVTVSVPAALD